MADQEESIFTRIIRREIPAEVVFEDDRVIVIRDINPQAPLHLLVIPLSPQYRDVHELASGDPDLLAHMVAVAGKMASEHADGQFRLVFNTGENAGQTVFHVHGHILAGGLDEGSLA